MPEAEKLIAEITQDLVDFGTIIDKQKNKPVEDRKREILNKIGDLEQIMVRAFPFE